MPDPLARPAHDELAGTLFERRLGPVRAPSTTELADRAALRSRSKRIEHILQLLRDRGPMATFELAATLGCMDNQISGRLTELKRDGIVEPTGERRRKPSTGCPTDVYRLVLGG